MTSTEITVKGCELLLVVFTVIKYQFKYSSIFLLFFTDKSPLLYTPVLVLVGALLG